MRGDRKKSYVFLTPKGKLLKSELVPLAETVNSIAIRGLKPADIGTTRDVLLAIIGNLAQDELARDRPVPSTRALKHVRAGRGLRRKRA
jgi:MarR family transcriptional regulator, organic hydroperoxide resistance regulator